MYNAIGLRTCITRVLDSNIYFLVCREHKLLLKGNRPTTNPGSNLLFDCALRRRKQDFAFKKLIQNDALGILLFKYAFYETSSHLEP